MKLRAKCSIRRIWLLLLLILALPVAYVLSIGPVLFIWRTFKPGNKDYAEMIWAFYKPLERIPQDSSMKKALNFYFRLWNPDQFVDAAVQGGR